VWLGGQQINNQPVCIAANTTLMGNAFTLYWMTKRVNATTNQNQPYF
jgi:hypothetical protein